MQLHLRYIPVTSYPLACVFPLGYSLHSLLRKKISGLVALATCETALTPVACYTGLRLVCDCIAGIAGVRNKSSLPLIKTKNPTFRSGIFVSAAKRT